MRHYEQQTSRSGGETAGVDINESGQGGFLHNVFQLKAPVLTLPGWEPHAPPGVPCNKGDIRVGQMGGVQLSFTQTQ